MPGRGDVESSGFGERLKAVREERGLTQKQLGDLASHSSEYNRENWSEGEQEPAWPLVLKLAAALGVLCTRVQRGIGAHAVRRGVKVGGKIGGQEASAEEGQGEEVSVLSICRRGTSGHGTGMTTTRTRTAQENAGRFHFFALAAPCTLIDGWRGGALHPSISVHGDFRTKTDPPGVFGRAGSLFYGRGETREGAPRVVVQGCRDVSCAGRVAAPRRCQPPERMRPVTNFLFSPVKVNTFAQSRPKDVPASTMRPVGDISPTFPATGEHRACDS